MILSKQALALCETYDNAYAIMDRLTANAHCFELKRESMRKKKKNHYFETNIFPLHDCTLSPRTIVHFRQNIQLNLFSNE
jgi:hypothetical protein